MKKLAIFAGLCSLTLFAAGCDNSPAAKQADADKKAVKAEGEALNADIKEDAKEKTDAVNDAVKDADTEIDAEKKAAEGK